MSNGGEGDTMVDDDEGKGDGDKSDDGKGDDSMDGDEDKKVMR